MQVIALTEELLSTAKQHENSGSNIEKSSGAAPGFSQYDWNEKVKQYFTWFCFLFGCSRVEQSFRGFQGLLIYVKYIIGGISKHVIAGGFQTFLLFIKL